MVDQIIVNYLNSNKRLVVPGLGAFLRKDPNDVVFIEFLKKDDGVLSALLCSAIDISTEEADAMITNYVSVINRQLRSTGRFTIEGLGELELNANGVCDLIYGAKPQPVAPSAQQTRVSEPNRPIQTPAPQPVANPFAKEPVQPISSPQRSSTAPQTATASQQTQQPVAPRPTTTTPPVSTPAPAPAPVPRPTVSQPQQPQVSAPAQHETTTQKPSYRSESGNNRATGNVRPKAKMDTIMLLAIVIAIVAVIALLYGVFVGSSHSGNLFDKSATSEDIEMIESDSVQQ